MAEADDIRVLIVDDQALLRASFRLLIETSPGLVAVGEASSGHEAVALARREQPDVILMDIRMPGMDGIEATRQICGSVQTRATRVLILTTFDYDEYVFGALRAGASGFLLKDVAPSDLITAVQVVAGGDGLLAPGITRRLIAHYATLPEEPARFAAILHNITDREREVLTLVATGLSNTEISEYLRVTLPTVKTHVGRLLAKLQARDRAQLVIVAYESGLVTPTR
ncbi:response regulator [Actinoplanes derwentensis]|uniref:DNA-binding response regulator, NarL/FixJ family, contains REC and HTH domains n=1 Tax=Actinoplanes derwentensis TaxID=113562 RepID=A0A1H2ACE7_9ACTN|nr:response regulator transcription factor [Actinoplanes derwentensis]GID88948.1 DNA-binding response regulator [Actinoplanes derwentensis]SDT43618.1 DNA-binding response regulator, NarL/FixJ family, contains REC and HTH domains [Actinoplanes derwentensis]